MVHIVPHSSVTEGSGIIARVCYLVPLRFVPVCRGHRGKQRGGRLANTSIFTGVNDSALLNCKTTNNTPGISFFLGKNQGLGLLLCPAKPNEKVIFLWSPFPVFHQLCTLNTKLQKKKRRRKGNNISVTIYLPHNQAN